VLPALLAAAAGWTDWRSRRIPNWITVPGLVLGVVVNSLVSGWPGAKAAVLGALLGVALLLPFVLHLPGPELSLDNPEALKVPFGIAVAIAVIVYSARQVWEALQG